MINLLPPAVRKEFVFARRNTFLARYLVGAGIGLAMVGIVLMAGLFLLQQESQSYQDSIAESENQLKAQNEQQTISRVNEISDSLKLVINVLGQEVLFSELLRQVGAVMPSQTVLQDLRLSNELSGALDLQAGAGDYTAATQVQLNLEDPQNRLFDRADIVSITCDGTDPLYPCTVTLRALFSKDNAFMLLSDKRGSTDE